MPNVFRPAFEPGERRGRGVRRAAVGRQAGTRALEASVYVLARGGSLERDGHDASEQMLVVLEGSPSLRGRRGWRHLVAGDVVVWPPGADARLENLTRAPARVLVAAAGAVSPSSR